MAMPALKIDDPMDFVADDSARDEQSIEHLERRWFVAVAAAKELESDCAALRRQMQRVEEAWRTASSQLAQVETIRDELTAQLAQLHGPQLRTYLDMDSA